MKKIAVILLAAVTLAAFAGCGNRDDGTVTLKNNTASKTDAASPKSSEQKTDASSENKESESEIDFSSVKTPAEVVTVDAEKNDPSNDDAKFYFDENGRISQCDYISDGELYSAVYTYTATSVQIYVFSSTGVVVKYEEFPLSGEYDPNGDIIVYEGYFIKGYKMG